MLYKKELQVNRRNETATTSWHPIAILAQINTVTSEMSAGSGTGDVVELSGVGGRQTSSETPSTQCSFIVIKKHVNVSIECPLRGH
jgi:hypothetical protein